MEVAQSFFLPIIASQGDEVKWQRLSCCRLLIYAIEHSSTDFRFLSGIENEIRGR